MRLITAILLLIFWPGTFLLGQRSVFFSQNISTVIIGSNTISFIAAASGSASSGTVTTSTTLNVLLNDTLIAVCGSGGSVNTFTITDTIGNTFGKNTHLLDLTVGNTDMLYTVATSSNSSDSFSCTNSSSASSDVITVLQYRGGISSGISDAATNGAATSAASWTTGTFSTTTPNEVVVQCSDMNHSLIAGTIGGVAATIRFQGGIGGFSCQDVIFNSVQTGITATLNISGGSGNYNGQLGSFR
jgi:hypothetical protein